MPALSFRQQQAARQAAKAATLTPSALAADAGQIRRFVGSVFMRCVDKNGKPIAGRIALRAFTNAKGNTPVLTEWEPLGSSPIARATAAATMLARRPAAQAAVFAPPVCVFTGQNKASEKDVLAGPVIAVDLDGDPEAGRRAAEAALGPPTLVVASGGVWTAPDGGEHDKLHLYWRLRQPAVLNEEKALLRAVRQRIAEIAGGDPTAAALCHPMRWPGSWHTKGTPRLCRIVDGDDSQEVDLQEVAAALRLDGGNKSAAIGDRAADGSFTTKSEWTAAQLLDVAARLPNDDLDWKAWNDVGMAFYDASHGSADGLEAFLLFCDKSLKHDEAAAEARWSHFRTSPPDRISGSWLIERVRNSVDPMYCLPAPSVPTEEERAAWEELFSDHRMPGDVEPQDIFGHDTFNLADPPLDNLPEMLAPWVRSEARRKGVSQAFTAISALTAVGAAIGASLRIQVRARDAGFVEPAALWSVLVADPGSAKSAVVSAALHPLKELDKAWMAEDQPRHAEWLHQSKKRKAEGALPEPRRRRAVVDDVTAERQVRIHHDNPRGVMRSTDELAGMLETLGAYKKSGGGDRSFMLRLFDGDSVTVDRVGSGTTFAKQALMSVLSGTQPEKLRSMVRDMQTDGLLQRFLFVLDDGARRRRIDEEEDTSAAAGYRGLIRQLATADYGHAAPIKISSEGRAHFDAFIDQVHDLKDLPGSCAAWRGHASKWEKLAARVVLIFHCIEHYQAIECVHPASAVEQTTVIRAVAFCRFLIRHQLNFYSQFFDRDPVDAEVVGLGGFLLTHPELKEIKRRDIYQARSSLKGAGNLRMLLKAAQGLEEAGWLHVTTREADGPSSWRVNGKIHERFAEQAEAERISRANKQESIKRAVEARKIIEGAE